jgi:hypothetical protein
MTDALYMISLGIAAAIRVMGVVPSHHLLFLPSPGFMHAFGVDACLLCILIITV